MTCNSDFLFPRVECNILEISKKLQYIVKNKSSEIIEIGIKRAKKLLDNFYICSSAL